MPSEIHVCWTESKVDNYLDVHVHLHASGDNSLLCLYLSLVLCIVNSLSITFSSMSILCVKTRWTNRLRLHFLCGRFTLIFTHAHLAFYCPCLLVSENNKFITPVVETLSHHPSKRLQHLHLKGFSANLSTILNFRTVKSLKFNGHCGRILRLCTKSHNPFWI